MKLKLLALLLLPVSAFAVGRLDFEHMKQVTVLVTNEGFLGGGRGSGVLIDETHVLTCAHMARSGNDQLFVYTYPFGNVVKAQIESVDMEHDLLLLRLVRPVQISSGAVFQADTFAGEPVTVVGNTLGSMQWYVTRGVISGTEQFFLMTDAQVHPGNSGGPWFNDRGEVVAISDWGLSKYPDVSGGISAKTIQDTFRYWDAQKHMMEALGGLFQ